MTVSDSPYRGVSAVVASVQRTPRTAFDPSLSPVSSLP